MIELGICLSGGIVMQDLIQIFLLNLITGIDNLFVIGAILRRSPCSRWQAVFCISGLVSISRTLCVLSFQSLFVFPGLKLASGLITLFISFRMIQSARRRSISLVYVLLLVITTDVTISLDSIIATASISNSVLPIFFGIFFSMVCLLILLQFAEKILMQTAWVQIFVAGMIAQIAIHEMMKDRLFLNGSGLLQTILTDIEYGQILSVAMGLGVIGFGIYNQLKYRKGS